MVLSYLCGSHMRGCLGCIGSQQSQAEHTMTFLEFLMSNAIVGFVVFVLLYACLWSIYTDLKDRAAYKRRIHRMRMEG